jgi:adenine-specific DNA-methyltransferase
MAKKPLAIEALKHDAKRLNIPTAEFESLMRDEEKSPVQVAYQRRNRDLDPQLVWRGKDEQDWSDLIVQAPPLYVQEKLHPKALIDDLKRQTKQRKAEADDAIPDLFSDFNGLADKEAVTEFYQHDLHWSNRMISGDSLSVMASLAEREGLRGQVQCIYFDPPYGIKFNSNFQWSTTSREVKDGAKDHVTREPEQVRAFRDTWRDGVNSYLTYLRDRLTVARDLLSDSGSIFVQIGNENVHRVRGIMDEVFGEDNFVAQIFFNTTGIQSTRFLSTAYDHIIWYAKSRDKAKYRQIYRAKVAGEAGATGYTLVQQPDYSIRGMTRVEKEAPDKIAPDLRILDGTPLISGGGSEDKAPIKFRGINFPVRPNAHWKTHADGRSRLRKADRIVHLGNRVEYKMFIADFGQTEIDNFWQSGGQRGFTGDKIYVVQTAVDVIQRCILMTYVKCVVFV